jgi:hypothetical protein
MLRMSCLITLGLLISFGYSLKKSLEYEKSGIKDILEDVGGAMLYFDENINSLPITKMR